MAHPHPPEVSVLLFLLQLTSASTDIKSVSSVCATIVVCVSVGSGSRRDILENLLRVACVSDDGPEEMDDAQITSCLMNLI